ncbi:hypothetical protein KY334_04775 [Candidatus Woesearchaeota archaeon]|nr:hypothetical protein [Candidatus Woesearchaeota archaeon]
MNKFMIIVLISSVVLTGCSRELESDTSNDELKTRCIGGVKYFLYKEQQGYGRMAMLYFVME